MPKGDGLTRPLKLSADLAAIVGVEEASRAECVKLLWAYLKANELQVLIDIWYISISNLNKESLRLTPKALLCSEVAAQIEIGL